MSDITSAIVERLRIENKQYVPYQNSDAFNQMDLDQFIRHVGIYQHSLDEFIEFLEGTLIPDIYEENPESATGDDFVTSVRFLKKYRLLLIEGFLTPRSSSTTD